MEIKNIVSDLEILKKEDIDKVNSELPLIQHAMVFSQKYRTETEARVSVLNNLKFPDVDSKYWQSIRELNGQSSSLVMLNYTYKEKLLDKEELELRISELEEAYKGKQSIELRRLHIRLDKLSFEIAQIELEAKDRIREVGMWSKIIKELEPNLKYSNTDVNEHQLLSYAVRFIREVRTLHSHGNNITAGEVRNIVGLLSTTLEKIKEQDLLPKLISNLTLEEKNFLQANKILMIGE